ncbi:MAG: hypothetical protein ACM32O_13420 [Clostridia bacterium]
MLHVAVVMAIFYLILSYQRNFQNVTISNYLFAVFMSTAFVVLFKVLLDLLKAGWSWLMGVN